MLNQDQKNFYDDNGYLMVENVLSKEQLTTMQNITYNWIESSKSVTESDSFFDLDEGHSKNSPRLTRLIPAFKKASSNFLSKLAGSISMVNSAPS